MVDQALKVKEKGGSLPVCMLLHACCLLHALRPYITHYASLPTHIYTHTTQEFFKQYWARLKARGVHIAQPSKRFYDWIRNAKRNAGKVRACWLLAHSSITHMHNNAVYIQEKRPPKQQECKEHCTGTHIIFSALLFHSHTQQLACCRRRT